MDGERGGSTQGEAAAHLQAHFLPNGSQGVLQMEGSRTERRQGSKETKGCKPWHCLDKDDSTKCVGPAAPSAASSPPRLSNAFLIVPKWFCLSLVDRVTEPRLVKNLYFTPEENLEPLMLLPLLPKISTVSYYVSFYSAGDEGSAHVRHIHGSHALCQ